MSARGFSPRNTAAWQLLAVLCACASAQQVLAQASASPYTYATRYDLMGRVTGTIAPDPDGTDVLLYLAVRNTYDDAGRLTKVESGQLSVWKSESVAPASWSAGEFTVYTTVETSYNAQNQKTLEVVKGSDLVATSATQYSYDVVGRLQCTAVRMNPAIYGSLPSACTLGTEGSFGPDRITKNVYDARGDLVVVQKAVGTSLQEDYATYTYSANGNRTSVTDARGYKAAMGYDGVDRQSTWNFPSPSTPGVASSTDYEQYGYDPNGNRTSFRKRDGSTLIYDYDALNRNWRKIVPERAGLDPTHTRDVYYGYDSFSRMTYARFDSALGVGESYVFNGFGEKTSSTNTMPGAETTTSYYYDADGNRNGLAYGDGNYFITNYDGLDRATSIVRSGTETNTRFLANYTYDSSGSRATFNSGFSTSYAYRPDGKLSTLTNTPIAPGYSVQYGFSYNPAAQITQTTRDNDAYAWNGATNANESYTVNGLNQYTSAIGATQTYDANGNLTSDGSTTYVYDVENRLVAASGAKNAALIYDPMGRLYAIGSPTITTRFAYDGDALLLEWNASGGMLARYVHGPDAGDDPIAYFVGSGFTNSEQRLVRPDYQGSIVLVGNADSSGLYVINTYDEYGLPGTSNAGRFQYTGQAWLPELGLYYYKARMYSPILGRFMQTDPIGYSDQINLYGYAGIDPINSTDPTGLCTGSIICPGGQCASGVSCIDGDSYGGGAVAGGGVKKDVAKAPASSSATPATVCQGGFIPSVPFCMDMDPKLANVVAGQQGAMAVVAGAFLTAAVSGPAISEAFAARGTASALETTAHGATRVAGAAATRGGVLSLEEIAATRTGGVLYESAKNGTVVHVLEASAGRYNVVIDGAKGLVTTFRNINYKALTRLACNYGWSCPL